MLHSLQACGPTLITFHRWLTEKLITTIWTPDGPVFINTLQQLFPPYNLLFWNLFGKVFILTVFAWMNPIPVDPICQSLTLSLKFMASGEGGVFQRFGVCTRRQILSGLWLVCLSGVESHECSSVSTQVFLWMPLIHERTSEEFSWWT